MARTCFGCWVREFLFTLLGVDGPVHIVRLFTFHQKWSWHDDSAKFDFSLLIITDTLIVIFVMIYEKTRQLQTYRIAKLIQLITNDQKTCI